MHSRGVVNERFRNPDTEQESLGSRHQHRTRYAQRLPPKHMGKRDTKSRLSFMARGAKTSGPLLNATSHGNCVFIFLNPACFRARIVAV